jgi:PAS domain S-box-containing protein
MRNKKINDPTREGEERYRLIAENTGDYIAILGIDGVLKYTSPSHRWLGYGPGELEGKNGLDLIHPDDKMKLLPLLKMYTKKAMDSIFRKHLADGSAAPEKLEFRFPDKKGNWVYLESTSNFIKSLTGKGYDILLVSRDITDRKGAEESLLKEKNFSEVAINSLPGIFYMFDENGRFLRWNRNFETISRYSGDEVGRMNPLDFFRGDDKLSISEAIKKVFAAGYADAEADFITKKEDTLPFYFTGARMEIEGKYYLVGMGIDVSERKKTEEEIRKKVAALEQYKELTVDRETRMVELKEEVNRLSEELGRPKPY